MFEICSDLSKTGLKLYYFFNIQKRPKMAKWQKHFISGKQFQKSPSGNPGYVHLQLCVQIHKISQGKFLRYS